jgi:superfamily II DNA or RNA helicase
MFRRWSFRYGVSRIDMLVTFPSVVALDEERAKNRIRHIAERTPRAEGTLSTFTRGHIQGHLFQSDGVETLIIPQSAKLPPALMRVVQATVPEDGQPADLRNGTWLRHPLKNGAGRVFDYPQQLNDIFQSWAGAFSYVQEDPDKGIKGLRNPQIGAVHSVHAHWSVAAAPATIVMPTGTGKTEVMLSVLVSAVCRRLLVVVPTDALRTQLAEKFLTLGVLKEPDCRVLEARAKCPIVGVLHHIPRNVAEVDDVFCRCHVIVTTSSIAGQCATEVQDRMAHLCTHLFIDEAHHTEAPTWSAFKERFRERKILQFTATPFREDGRPLDGDIVFKYPLKKAQQENYFKPIRFRPVVEFNPKRSDEAIAAKAIETLKADFDKGHILMARAENVARAKSVFKLYEKYPEFRPVQLHTGIKSPRQREVARRQIIGGESRIVVCVDMLGEGFDLPELKIAAFHDIRKTLAVTLQLAGRFTRSRADLGDATFIANTADVNVQDELRKLYGRDPDWNVLLPELSDRMIGEQMSLQEFLRGFTQFAKEIPLKTVRPALSTVVYRTNCHNWTPENFREGIPGLDACEQVHEAVNHNKRTLIVVTARHVPLPWADVESLFGWEWDLYVVIWSPEQNLLYINASGNAGEYEKLAEAVAGDDVTLIRGQDVFRTLAGVNRLRLQNVGLTEQLGRNVRYTGRMGADVAPALSDIQRGRARKSVLSGSGYEDGERVTVGASRKGRIWSHRRDHVDQLAAWCRKVGDKLLDASINPDEVLKGTLDVKTVAERPAKMPVRIDWPEEIYLAPEADWSVTIGDRELSMAEVSIDLVNPAVNGALRLALTSESESAELALEFFDDHGSPNYRLVPRSEVRAQIVRGAIAQDAAAFFYDCPPIIWFADGSSLEGNQYAELRSPYPHYDAARIQTWDWEGVDLRKESQGSEKDQTSVQARVIRELETRDYAIIMDDDGKGELADVVAVRLAGNAVEPSCIEVEFYHCKYSRDAAPGRRIEDLYEVCGQAQKSVAWASSPEKRSDIFTHLMRRETQRRDAGALTRFEVGDSELLLTIREMSRLIPVNLSIYVVQPGVSRANATPDQLALMSVTEHYLSETYQLRFGVIASD